ncbi:MAG TPA: hypothetical protein VNW50_07775 [Streptosporangiaceae bacterium]|jgi:hypothetical protein|nr:hypothetical protein [Streptosporangiaceae bacterium]
MRALMPVLRGYWSVALLGVAALVFLVIGAPSKAALAGAGFAFVGAAITRGIDIARQRGSVSREAIAARRRDLDETRRLAYAMLAKCPSDRDPVLVATVLNALVHHGLSVDYLTAFRHLARVDTGEDPDKLSAHWLQVQIELINQQLDPDSATSARQSSQQ